MIITLIQPSQTELRVSSNKSLGYDIHIVEYIPIFYLQPDLLEVVFCHALHDILFG